MKALNIFLPLISVYLPFCAYSNTTKIPRHIIDHPLEGCPTNSLCSKEVSILRKSFLDLLKSGGPKDSHRNTGLRSFARKNGIPFDIWMKKNDLNDKNLIYWESTCKNHRSLKSRIYEGMFFIKSVDLSYLRSRGIIAHHGILWKGEKNFNYYPLPRDQTPILMMNQELLFTLEMEGHYFGMSVSPKGKINIISTQFPTHKESSNIPCPKELEDEYNFKAYNNLYISSFCKNIWSVEDKRFYPMIFGWSCN